MATGPSVSCNRLDGRIGYVARMSATTLASACRRHLRRRVRALFNARWKPVAGAVSVLVAAPSGHVAAQGGSSIAVAAPARLDEGSFTLLVDGQRAGREQFSVQRVASADGATLALRAESAMGDRRSAVRLEADSAGTPVRYTVEARRGAETTLRLGGQRVRGRFATLARSSTGEAAREYLLRPEAVVVEDDGLVQYAVLVLGRKLATGDSITLPSLMPSANSQGTVRLVLEATDDQVVVAGTRLAARRWRVVAARDEVRRLWTDADGRLLRVTIAARRLDAIRDDVPR